MPTIYVRNNNLDGAFKNLRTQLAKDGTLSKARDRAEGYKKTGLRNRLEKEIDAYLIYIIAEDAYKIYDKIIEEL